MASFLPVHRNIQELMAARVLRPLSGPVLHHLVLRMFIITQQQEYEHSCVIVLSLHHASLLDAEVNLANLIPVGRLSNKEKVTIRKAWTSPARAAVCVLGGDSSFVTTLEIILSPEVIVMTIQGG
jgi:hypothetical protein